MSKLNDPAYRQLLRDVMHFRLTWLYNAEWADKELSGPKWPKTDADWRQTPHGAPWDTNIHMAEETIKLYKTIRLSKCVENFEGEQP